MKEMVFTHSILDSPLCANIKSVELGTRDSHQLDFAMIHALSRLPELTRLGKLDQKMTKFLFGSKGIRAGRKLGSSYYAHEKVYAWRKFKAVALRIRHWQLELDYEEVEALFDIDPIIKTNLLSLSLSAPFEDPFSILETDSSKFPALLSSLPSLSSLSLDKSYSAASRNSPNISKVAFATSYRFASTLTSFTWVGDSDDDYVKLDLLQFLTRFKSLRHLRLDAAGFVEPDSFDFSAKPRLQKLTDLELVGVGPNGLDKLLDYLILPNLVVLKLSPEYSYAEGFFALETKQIEDLYWRIFRWKDSLRHVYIGGFDGLYQLSLDQISTGSFYGKKVIPPYTIHTSWQPGEPEAETSDCLAEYPQDPYKIQQEEIREGMMEGVEELHGWVGDEIARAKVTGDSAKAKQLLRAMKPVWELREWNKD
jgi:hypothetical protein